MKIDSKLKEITIPDVKPKRRVDGFIWGLLLGMIIQLVVVIFILRPFFPVAYWATRHPEEMKWTMDRYDTIQKASHVLFFEDQMQGVTIVKPQVNTFKGE